jgi:hypothetical protein
MIHVTHRRTKIERVYCPYLTAWEEKSFAWSDYGPIHLR